MNQNPNYHNWNQMQTNTTTVDAGAVASKTFMTQVFAWMAGALVITALMSYLFGMVPALTEMLYKTFEGKVVGFTGLGWVVLLSPLAFVILISAGVNKLPFPLLVGAFLMYSALTGMSLSSIFLRYEIGSIGATFFVAGGMFATMAIMGFITKADLSGFGRIMMMGLVGLCLAMLVNFFMRSGMMSYIISFAGVAIFTGLTAYDVQKLKNIGAQTNGDQMAARLSILGALTLYLDFLNIFLFLLRIMGSRK
jgi:uncharacterized protein